MIRQFPAGGYLWGAGRVDSRVKAGVGVFLYVTKNQYNEGGLVLYGRLLDVREFSGRYWPSGEWRHLLPIKTEKVAEGVIESPNDPAKWRLPDRRRLEEPARANYTRTVLAAMAEANATRSAIEMLIKAAGANATEAARLAELYIYLSGLREVAQTGNVQILAISGGAGQAVPVIPITR